MRCLPFTELATTARQEERAAAEAAAAAAAAAADEEERAAAQGVAAENKDEPPAESSKKSKSKKDRKKVRPAAPFPRLCRTPFTLATMTAAAPAQNASPAATDPARACCIRERRGGETKTRTTL